MKYFLLITLIIFMNGCSNINHDNQPHEDVDYTKHNINLSDDYIRAKKNEKSNPNLYLSYLIKAAEKDDPIAQDELAGEYAFGNIINKDGQKYEYWQRRSAEQGYSIAQLNLGVAYYTGGNGVKKNISEAKNG